MLEAATVTNLPAVLPDLSQPVEPAKITTKDLWEALASIGQNYKGLQWKALAVSVMLLAKGSKEKTIRDRLTKDGVTWASKVVTMATRIADGDCIDFDAILNEPASNAINMAIGAIEVHAASLKVKNFDQYYYVCGEAEYNDKVKRTIERLKAKKAKAKDDTKAKGETEGEGEPEGIQVKITPCQAAILAVQSLDMADLMVFDDWYQAHLAKMTLANAA